jgi:hypothetical protein
MGWLRLACVGLLALTDETYRWPKLFRVGGTGGAEDGREAAAAPACSGALETISWCGCGGGLSVTTIVCMEVLYVCMYGQYCTGEVER